MTKWPTPTQAEARHAKRMGEQRQNPDAQEVAQLVFETDYKDKQAVINLARRLGRGLIVIKHADRPNYNIVHNTRRDRWDKPGIKVIART